MTFQLFVNIFWQTWHAYQAPYSHKKKQKLGLSDDEQRNRRTVHGCGGRPCVRATSAKDQSVQQRKRTASSQTYKSVRPPTVYALNNGVWGLPTSKVPEFIKRYAAEHERFYFGLVSLKTDVHPYLLDIDQTELASSLGGPIVVLKIIMDTFEDDDDGQGSQHRPGLPWSIASMKDSTSCTQTASSTDSWASRCASNTWTCSLATILA